MRHDSSGLAGWENIECDVDDGANRVGAALDESLKRTLDFVVAAALLFVLAPVILILALAIRIESTGPAFYRCRRVGRGGREFHMLKFRKMHDGAKGPALASWEDDRFTRMGPFLAGTKLDELPQLWNVLRGQMSLVGPRPEDGSFVELMPAEFAVIHSVKPGITGLCQLAFARESKILDPEDRVGHYVNQILPQKVKIDQLYASKRSIGTDLQILGWTALAVLFRREVAVHRQTGSLSRRAPRGEGQQMAVGRVQA
jgi:lipopolysaccharide/colanic/teichoic acid biosynthesis glycosyltransferase